MNGVCEKCGERGELKLRIIKCSAAEDDYEELYVCKTCIQQESKLGKWVINYKGIAENSMSN